MANNHILVNTLFLKKNKEVMFTHCHARFDRMAFREKNPSITTLLNLPYHYYQTQNLV